MNIQSKNNLIYVIILSVVMLACNLTTPQSAPSDNEASPAPTMEPAVVEDTTEESTIETENVPSSESSPVQYVEITELYPCDLVTQASAEIALGQSVDKPILASDTSVTSCTYIAVPGEKFATVAVYEGVHSKNYLLNEIEQLQADCELTMSTGEQPTTFSSEVEALRSQSILALLQQDLEISSDCWKAHGFSYEQITDLGENVYFFPSFLQGAVIGVATEDAYITFLIADINATPEQALEAVTELVKLSTAK